MEVNKPRFYFWQPDTQQNPVLFWLQPDFLGCSLVDTAGVFNFSFQFPCVAKAPALSAPRERKTRPPTRPPTHPKGTIPKSPNPSHTHERERNTGEARVGGRLRRSTPTSPRRCHRQGRASACGRTALKARVIQAMALELGPPVVPFDPFFWEGVPY